MICHTFEHTPCYHTQAHQQKLHDKRDARGGSTHLRAALVVPEKTRDDFLQMQVNAQHWPPCAFWRSTVNAAAMADSFALGARQDILNLLNKHKPLAWKWDENVAKSVRWASLCIFRMPHLHVAQSLFRLATCTST